MFKYQHQHQHQHRRWKCDFDMTFFSSIDKFLPLRRKQKVMDWRNFYPAWTIFISGCVLAFIAWELGASWIIVSLYMLLGIAGLLIVHANKTKIGPNRAPETSPLLSCHFKVAAYNKMKTFNDKECQTTRIESIDAAMRETHSAIERSCNSSEGDRTKLNDSTSIIFENDAKSSHLMSPEQSCNSQLSCQKSFTTTVCPSHVKSETESCQGTVQHEKKRPMLNVFRQDSVSKPSVQPVPLVLTAVEQDSGHPTEKISMMRPPAAEADVMETRFMSSKTQRQLRLNFPSCPRRVSPERDLAKFNNYEIPKRNRALGEKVENNYRYEKNLTLKTATVGEGNTRRNAECIDLKLISPKEPLTNLNMKMNESEIHPPSSVISKSFASNTTKGNEVNLNIPKIAGVVNANIQPTDLTVEESRAGAERLLSRNSNSHLPVYNEDVSLNVPSLKRKMEELGAWDRNQNSKSKSKKYSTSDYASPAKPDTFNSNDLITVCSSTSFDFKNTKLPAETKVMRHTSKPEYSTVSETGIFNLTGENRTKNKDVQGLSKTKVVNKPQTESTYGPNVWASNEAFYEDKLPEVLVNSSKDPDVTQNKWRIDSNIAGVSQYAESKDNTIFIKSKYPASKIYVNPLYNANTDKNKNENLIKKKNRETSSNMSSLESLAYEKRTLSGNLLKSFKPGTVVIASEDEDSFCVLKSMKDGNICGKRDSKIAETETTFPKELVYVPPANYSKAMHRKRNSENRCSRSSENISSLKNKNAAPTQNYLKKTLSQEFHSKPLEMSNVKYFPDSGTPTTSEKNTTFRMYPSLQKSYSTSGISSLLENVDVARKVDIPVIPNRSPFVQAQLQKFNSRSQDSIEPKVRQAESKVSSPAVFLETESDSDSFSPQLSSADSSPQGTPTSMACPTLHKSCSTSRISVVVSSGVTGPIHTIVYPNKCSIAPAHLSKLSSKSQDSIYCTMSRPVDSKVKNKVGFYETMSNVNFPPQIPRSKSSHLSSTHIDDIPQRVNRGRPFKGHFRATMKNSRLNSDCPTVSFNTNSYSPALKEKNYNDIYTIVPSSKQYSKNLSESMADISISSRQRERGIDVCTRYADSTYRAESTTSSAVSSKENSRTRFSPVYF